VIRFADRNSRSPNSCSRSIGADTRPSTTTSSASNVTPSRPGIQIDGVVQPRTAPSDNANINDAKPIAASRNPGTSSRESVRRAILGTANTVKITARIPIGRLIQKIHRQLARCTTKPPSTGPIAGASAIGMLMIRLSRTRSDGGNVRYNIAIPTGVISPPPSPWTIRKITNCCTVAANPQAADARVNSVTAARNTSRAPNRSPSQPATGIATATATRNPMLTVAVSSTGTPRSAAMVGSATLTTVASMIVMNIAATKTVATAACGLIRTAITGCPAECRCSHPAGRERRPTQSTLAVCSPPSGRSPRRGAVGRRVAVG